MEGLGGPIALALGETTRPGLMHNRRFPQLLPFTPLLLLPLLLWKFFDASQQSLTAWDEGLYMWRARLFLDQSEAWSPFAQAHHKTPGHYWIVALSMRLFGVSDITARLPFVLLALLSAWLVYGIGSQILGRRAGALASLILGTSYLWAVYSRRVSPDLGYRPGNSFTEALDLRQHGFGRSYPHKRSGLRVVVLHKGGDFAGEFSHLMETTASDSLLGNDAKPAFHFIDP